MANLFNDIKHLRNNAQFSLKEEQDMLRSIYKISPLQTEPTKSWKLSVSYVTLLSRKFATIALLIGLTGGIGITAAADNSLPNQSLYVLKIHVTEPIRELTRFTPESKAEFQKEIINRRFEEATTLAQTGELNTEIEQTLATRVQERVEKVKDLSESIINVEDKLILSTDLKNIIETKSNELASVIENNEKEEDKNLTITSSQSNNEAKNLDDNNEAKKVEPVTTEVEKTSVATSSLLAIADVIVSDIKVEQSTTIKEVAKEDPTKALELSKQVYEQEFVFLSQEVTKNLETAHTNILSLQLLIPEATAPTITETTSVTSSTNLQPLPNAVPPTTPETTEISQQVLPLDQAISQVITETTNDIEAATPTDSTVPVVTIPLISTPIEKTNFEKYQELEKAISLFDQKVAEAKKTEPSESSIILLKNILTELQGTNTKITNIINMITSAQEKNVPSFISSSISTLSDISTKENETTEPSTTNLTTQ